MTPPAVAIGVDIGGTNLRAGRVRADGSIDGRQRAASPADDAEALVATIVDLVETLDSALPVGVGVAGMVDRAGALRYGPNIAARDVPLGFLLTEKLRRPVRIVNDATAAAVAEQRLGAGRGAADVVALTIGTGVGGGIVAAGHPVVGGSGFAGELGHLRVVEAGRRCACGGVGCVEAYASATAIAQAAGERLAAGEPGTVLGDGSGTNAVAVVEAASRGDVLARAVLADAGRVLGRAIAMLCTALDPAVVVVGGGAGPAVLPWMQSAIVQVLREELFAAGMRDLPAVVPAELADDAGTVGAALLAAEAAGSREERM